MSTFHIVFPGGDRTRLSVVELSDACHYELCDYAVASRHEFQEEYLASEYARDLAKKHNLIFEGDSEGYLD